MRECLFRLSIRSSRAGNIERCQFRALRTSWTADSANGQRKAKRRISGGRGESMFSMYLPIWSAHLDRRLQRLLIQFGYPESITLILSIGHSSIENSCTLQRTLPIPMDFQTCRITRVRMIFLGVCDSVSVIGSAHGVCSFQNIQSTSSWTYGTYQPMRLCGKGSSTSRFWFWVFPLIKKGWWGIVLL